jgi:hypothetical protein
MTFQDLGAQTTCTIRAAAVPTAATCRSSLAFRSPNTNHTHVRVGADASSDWEAFPTSGNHWGAWAPWSRVYPKAMKKGFMLHNLEHGGILIQYRTEDKELVAQIEGFARKQSRFPGCLIVAPYPDMDYPIALTAWGMLLPLEGYDETAMQGFIDAYRRVDLITTQDRSLVLINRRGPELADCNQ